MTKILLTLFALPRLSDAASAQPCKQFRVESTGAVTNYDVHGNVIGRVSARGNTITVY